MSILDGDHNPLNIPFPTMGGKHFWTDLAHEGSYTLQQNDLTKHCRILNQKNIRVAWGTEAAMRVKLQELTGALPRRVQYGDVIGIHRVNGLFDHYGVYESDSCVYEYAPPKGDFSLRKDICVRASTLEKFLDGSDHFFILHFPEEYGDPAKVDIYTVDGSASTAAAKVGKAAIKAAAPILALTFPVLFTVPLLQEAAGQVAAVGRTLSPSKRPAAAQQDYHLYTPQETIQRAKSRLGETEYNLAFNNCEHFAIWCKTGLHQSHQVDAVLDAVSAAVSNALHVATPL